jgi:NAD(P)-dependent dehydrogenase (short-subunit alcohol dehydrogenase family)
MAAFVRTDVSVAADVERAVELPASQSFRTLGGAVSCAGVGAAKKVLSKAGAHGLDEFNRVVNVNFGGTFNIIRLVAHRLAAQQPDSHSSDHERGVLIQTASIAAFDGQVGQAAYSASKGGIVAMTLPVARELSKLGIRVVTIAPGLFDTPLLQALPEKARLELGAAVPFPPRLGRPDEYAALVEHIINNRMLNGEVIRLDGSLRMQ